MTSVEEKFTHHASRITFTHISWRLPSIHLLFTASDSILSRLSA